MLECNRTPSRVHLSKSILQLWERCRLAYHFERIDREEIEVAPSAAQRRGSAGHAAVAAV